MALLPELGTMEHGTCHLGAWGGQEQAASPWGHLPSSLSLPLPGWPPRSWAELGGQGAAPGQPSRSLLFTDSVPCHQAAQFLVPWPHAMLRSISLTHPLPLVWPLEQGQPQAGLPRKSVTPTDLMTLAVVAVSR